MNAICLNCGAIERTVAQQIGGKITLGLASATFGMKAVKDPLIAGLCGLAGLAIGHYIDQEVSRKCPQCGALLQIMGLLP
jgi:hypothetical protein